MSALQCELRQMEGGVREMLSYTHFDTENLASHTRIVTFLYLCSNNK